ncbi:hypothetical protein GCM10023086_75230 [Streptomyces venetus]|uniref:Uncharacterized protein n=1 Tax=Streptomyces venetus TaxID=1701086 RepID=A0ABP8HJ66_9ACTN
MRISSIVFAGIESVLLREPVLSPDGSVYGSPEPSSSNLVIFVIRPCGSVLISFSSLSLCRCRETAALAVPLVAKEIPAARAPGLGPVSDAPVGARGDAVDQEEKVQPLVTAQHLGERSGPGDQAEAGIGILDEGTPDGDGTAGAPTRPIGWSDVRWFGDPGVAAGTPVRCPVAVLGQR